MSPTPHEQQLPRIVSYPGAQLEHAFTSLPTKLLHK